MAPGAVGPALDPVRLTVISFEPANAIDDAMVQELDRRGLDHSAPMPTPAWTNMSFNTSSMIPARTSSPSIRLVEHDSNAILGLVLDVASPDAAKAFDSLSGPDSPLAGLPLSFRR